MKKIKVIFLFIIFYVNTPMYGQSDFRFENIINLKNISNQEIYIRAINWHIGARRVSKIKKVYSETGILGSQKTVTFTNDSISFLQTGLDIIISKPRKLVVSFTVKLEITNNQCKYVIENFYYKILADKKGPCYQYINILNDPPENCKTTWGLAFYSKANENVMSISTEYVETYLIPELNLWLRKKCN